MLEELKHDDWCLGCETPVGKRVNLPRKWLEGDTIPPNLTVHANRRGSRRFAFRGAQHLRFRVYFD